MIFPAAADYDDVRFRRSRHSTLRAWLTENHDAFTAVVAEAGADLRWQIVAQSLADRGLLDGNGHRPTAGTVRAAWWRVRRQVELGLSTRRPKRKPRTTKAAPPDVLFLR